MNKKTLQLLGIGIVPLIPGFLLMAWLIPALPAAGLRLLPVLSVLLLLAWGFAAYKLSNPAGNIPGQTFLLCAFALLMLLLILVQELAMGHYWDGPLGLLPQAFFLPWLSLHTAVTSFLASMIGPSAMPMWVNYLVIWICLFAAGCIGCSVRRRR